MSNETVDTKRPLTLAWSAPRPETAEKPAPREATPEEIAAGRKKISAEADRATGKFLEFVNRNDYTQESFRKALSRSGNWIGWGFMVDPDLQVELVRKVHKHREFLTRRRQQEIIVTVIECATEESPLVFDLVTDLMKSGDPQWCEALADRYLLRPLALEEPPDDFRPTVEAALVEGTTPALGRALAVLFMGMAGLRVDPRTAGPLLRDDSWIVRLLAFAGLRRAGCLTAADLELTLRAHVELNSRDDDDEDDDPWRLLHHWNTELEQAVCAMRPVSCLPLLIELAGGSAHRYVSSLFAARMLAVTFPDRALPFIDKALREFSSMGRQQAVEAAALLPPGEAIPRLERCSSDPVPSVAKEALEALSALGKPHRVGPSAAIPDGILQGPPTIGFARRLVIARNPGLEPRKALRDELVSEAKAGRATAEDALLFVMLLCDYDLQRDAPAVDGLYGSFVRWMVAMRPHFGPALGLSLAALEQRFTVTSWDGPFAALRELSSRDLLGDEEREVMRGLAGRMFQSKEKGLRDEGLRTLAAVGAPATFWPDLFAELAASPYSHYAREALEKAPASRELDALIEKELAGPTKPEHREQLLLLGIARRVPPVIETARAAVQNATGVEDVSRASKLVPPLLRAGGTSIDALLGGLEDPKSPRFGLGLAAAYEMARWDERTAAALHRTLEHGSGPALRDVLILFINRRLIGTKDPRLPGILSRLEPGHRGAALLLMLLQGGDPTPLAAQLAELMLTDAQAARVLGSMLEDSEAGRAILKDARARRR